MVVNPSVALELAVPIMAAPSGALITRSMPRGAGKTGHMSDEQLIALRRIFQAIDSTNNGSITPASLTDFYQEVRSPLGKE